MSLLNRLVDRPDDRAMYGGNEQRVITGSAAIPSPMDWWGLGGDAGYASVGDRQALQSMTVYGCVRILADIISTLPMDVYRDDADGFPVKMKKPPPLIRQPSPDMTDFDWKFMQVVSLCLRGNAFNYVTGFDSDGWPSGLLPLHPDIVSVDVPVGSDFDWTHPRYRVAGQVIENDRIVHIRRFTQPGWAEGLSPIRQAAATIGMALAAENYGYRYFKDASNPSGALMTDQSLPEKDVKQVQKEWISTHGGRRLPAVLTGGFKFAPISITPEESQFLATRQFQDNQIQRIFGIPPHMLGDHEKASSWGTGIEQITIGFVTYTLQAWLTLFEKALSAHLPRPQYVKFDVDGLLRGDHTARAAWYTAMRNNGAFNADDIRAGENMPPIAGGKGQIYLQPVNYAPLGYDPAKASADAAKLHAETLAKGSGDQGDNQQDQDPPAEGGQQGGSGDAQP